MSFKIIIIFTQFSSYIMFPFKWIGKKTPALYVVMGLILIMLTFQHGYSQYVDRSQVDQGEYSDQYLHKNTLGNEEAQNIETIYRQKEQQLDNNLTQQILNEQQLNQESHYHKPSEAQFWWNFILAMVLTAIGAFCSGMTVGFCSIDKLQLQVMTMSKNPYERKMAKSILEVVGNHHLWLCTLLVYNAIALESLPLVAHTLMPDWMAIIFSTIVVLIAAQIVPQAVCTGPKKMLLAYYAAPIVHIMRKLMFFIIYPIAKGLDWLMGAHSHQRIQHKDFATFLTGNKILKQTEKMLLTSTLQLRCQRVLEKMIPIKKLYTFECNEILTKEKVEDIMKKDYSHVLIYRTNKDEIVGVIKVKQFALQYLRCENKVMKADQVMDTRTPMLSVYKDTNLLEMLMLFQANSNRIALICDQKRKTASGIPSIMYTKNDMIMNKKGAKIIGAIFLYQIFDELTNYEESVPLKNQHAGEQFEMKEIKHDGKGLKESLIGSKH